MTQLKLLEINKTTDGNGFEKITIKAVSSSWSALKSYCKETFGKTPNDPNDFSELTYEIQKSDIVIVQDNISKYDK